MTPNRNLNLLFRVIALLVVTAAVAWLVQYVDASSLARMDRMSAEEYMAYQHHVHGHGYTLHFFTMLIFGGFYLGTVEFIVYVLRLCFPARVTTPAS